MIDFSSPTSFVHSEFPHNDNVERWLYAELNLEEDMPTASALLAQRGYIGCLPFAHWRDDSEFAIRFLPNQPLVACPIVILSAFSTEGRTLASNIGQFVAAQIADRKLGTGKTVLTNELRADLFEFAASFNENVGNVQNVLMVADALNQQADVSNFNAMRLAVDPTDELYQALVELKQRRKHSLGEWVSTIIGTSQTPLDMILRRYVVYHILYKTNVDVTNKIWELTQRDMIFDVSFSITRGGWFEGGWDKGAISRGVKWLAKTNPPRIPISHTLWEGVNQFAIAPDEYSGTLHLDFAHEIALENPTLAYTHACNAACQWYRAKETTPVDSIIFAHELAVSNEWHELITILSWTRTHLGI